MILGMDLYVLSISLLNTFVGYFWFWFSIDVGTLLNLTLVAVNCLKLPFLNHLENIIISGSIPASFCHHVS